MNLIAIPDNRIFRVAELFGIQREKPLVLLNDPEFRVEVVPLTVGQQRNEKSDYGTFLQIPAGKATIYAVEQKFILRAGESFFLPAGTSYTIFVQDSLGYLQYNLQTGGGLERFSIDGSVPENAKKSMANVPVLKPFHLEELARPLAAGVTIASLFVTSRVKLNLMTYDVGQRIGPHGRPFEGWITMLEGEIQFEISNQTYNLCKGDCLRMPPDLVHCATALTKYAKCQMLVIKKPDKDL